ncbi:CDP-glycerol glycerophosphotransferase family protein [Motilibacter aurantiacus]|uniref:CDP-glycerol glycerophosphotransferase family protein n=1 Tax=Motilibacter aurantiacus TaxID=2714955 RepID=UPI00140CFCFB|nr:hypothetical protein [Motilibacter aurantiacus]
MTPADAASPLRHAVVVEIEDLALPQVQVVVSAAVQVFTANDPVEVVLTLQGVDEPTQAHAEAVQQICTAAVADLRALPEVLLVGQAEAEAVEALRRVPAGRDEAENARSIALLTLLARELWDATDATAEAPSEQAAEPATDAVHAGHLMVLMAQRDRARVEAAISRRDVLLARDLTAGRRKPHVVLLVQQRQTWSSVSALCAELAAHPDLDFTLTAIDTVADGTGASTAQFLREQGYDPRDGSWLASFLDDVDVLVVDNPYDEFRPAELSATVLAERGVRLVSVPYGNNAIDGALMTKLLWDLPLQRFAWRAYLPSREQARLYAAHCAAGDAPVRVLGSPKLDVSLRSTPRSWGRELRARAKGRRVVLWNPHFRMEEGGWSTFHLYLQPMLQRFLQRSDLMLIIRPHFRLFADLALLEGGPSRVEQTLRRVADENEHIVLDLTADYTEALAAADAMMSDLSSLATVFMPTGKPLLYLRREDGPGTNAEGAYFEAMYQARSWADVEEFLELVRRGKDPQEAERAAAVHRHFPFADGRASERIVADIVDSLRAELFLEDDAVGAGLLQAAGLRGDR